MGFYVLMARVEEESRVPNLMLVRLVSGGGYFSRT